MMRSIGLGRPQSNLDFASRLTSAKHVDAMLTQIADVAQEWLSRQSIFPNLIPVDVRQEVRDFYASYLSSPFRDRTGNGRLIRYFGSRSWQKRCGQRWLSIAGPMRAQALGRSRLASLTARY